MTIAPRRRLLQSTGALLAAAALPHGARAALGDSEVKQRLLEAGAEAAPSRPDQFGVQLRAEIDKWARVIQAAGIQAE
ncbi:MAG: hypothetical protein GX644_04555 [Limnobacter sp.]|nr:hypothetical protein [Limnobacter sp.]